MKSWIYYRHSMQGRMAVIVAYLTIFFLIFNTSVCNIKANEYQQNNTPRYSINKLQPYTQHLFKTSIHYYKSYYLFKNYMPKWPFLFIAQSYQSILNDNDYKYTFITQDMTSNDYMNVIYFWDNNDPQSTNQTTQPSHQSQDQTIIENEAKKTLKVNTDTEDIIMIDFSKRFEELKPRVSATSNNSDMNADELNEAEPIKPIKEQIITPMSYSFHSTKFPHIKMSIHMPVTISEFQNDRFYAMGLGAGLIFPINQYWNLKPTLNLDTKESLLSGGITSAYCFDVGDLKINIDNRFSMFRTIHFNPDEELPTPLYPKWMISGLSSGHINMVVRNAIRLSLPMEIIDPYSTFELYVIDTRCFGDTLLFEEYNEVGFSLSYQYDQEKPLGVMIKSYLEETRDPVISKIRGYFLDITDFYDTLYNDISRIKF